MQKNKINLRILSLGFLIFGTFLVINTSQSASYDAQLAKNLSGRILLQVESNGEAWYINPSTHERSFLGRPEDAFRVMRQEAIGITSADLAKIPLSLEHVIDKDSDGDGLSDDFEVAIGTNPNNKDTDGDGFDDYTELFHGFDPLKANGARLNYDLDFSSRQKGKILLDVERNGEAWYVNPEDGKRYFLGRPSDAFNVMRSLGLGISNANINKIAVNAAHSIDNKPVKGESNNNDSKEEPKDVALYGDYRDDILACTKNKTFSFSAVAEHPFAFSVLVSSDIVAKIEGLDSDNDCGITYTTNRISVQQDYEMAYNLFISIIIEDGYTEHDARRIFEEPLSNLNESELSYVQDEFPVSDDLSRSLKNLAQELIYDVDSEIIELIEQSKDSLPIYTYCFASPELMLEQTHNYMNGAFDLVQYSYENDMVVSNYKNGVVCHSDDLLFIISE